VFYSHIKQQTKHIILYARYNVLLSLDIVTFWTEAFVEFNLFTVMIWGSHSEDCEDFCPLEEDAMIYDTNVRTLWRKMLSRF
jgi:hypothetical protein